MIVFRYRYMIHMLTQTQAWELGDICDLQVQ
jgi:hypothetical protein